MDWRPMTEAPRDGTDILVWMRGDTFPLPARFELYDTELAAEIGEPGYWRFSDDLIADVCQIEDGSDLIAWTPFTWPDGVVLKDSTR